jgi:ERCC4-type nuclease
MHPLDVKSALESMVCLVDTREQDTPLFRKRMQSLGVPHERHKLNFGDYSVKCDRADLSASVSVERKMHLDELCNCFCKDRKRFEREFERAKKAGAKVYLLVEDASWEQAYNGKYRSKMAPASLVASMQAWLARYNCQIIMCKQETSGKLIHDILYRELKEHLEAMDDEGSGDDPATSDSQTGS